MDDSAAGARDGAGLWRNPDFVKLWVGQTCSQVGSQVSMLVLPLVAVIALQAPPEQVGLLASAEQVPFLLVALLAGVMVDRRRRRRDILIVADLGRAVALGAVTAAYLTERLGMGTLYVAAFLIGTCSVFFEIAYQAYLPRLIRRDQLGRGNGLLETSRSAAQIAGPALGGSLVQLLTAPVATVGSVISFLLSAASISLIRRPETRTAPDGQGQGSSALGQILEGLQHVGRNASLRTMAITAAIYNFSSSACMTVYLVFLPRELHLSPGAIGLVFAALGPGFLLASVLSRLLPARMGYGPALVLLRVAACLVITAIAAVQGNGLIAVALLVAINLVYAASAQTANIIALTIRQAMTPDVIQGRVAATIRFAALGGAPFGAACGGLLAGALSLRTGLLISAIGMCLALVFLIPSPLARLGREIPAVPAEVS
ncbi:MFS transporter [Microbispora sp. H10670]|uniref:MFS transporter n=1 Tax=Microbispora sp. H10670 TaxID=2729108 RepID=UPI0016013EF9|nr:MFS transporter [Microbispora sp. H10670]